jgi:sugar phosphate isomerase/epimerase
MTQCDGKQFTRRDVLAFALGAAGFAAVGGKTALGAMAPATEKTRMKIGCGTVSFRKRPLREALERIRRAGYEYFETQATGPWCPHVDVVKDDPLAFRKLADDLGFKGVTGLWAGGDMAKTIHWAQAAGIPIVHTGDGHIADSVSEEDALKQLRDRLASILEVAEKCRVYVAIEPHGNFSLTADGLKKIMALSDSKWLGINYDTANVHRVMCPGAYSFRIFGRRQNEVAALDAVADRVIHVHVKDVVGPKCVALGEGEVNVLGCLRVLEKHRYAGVVSLETEGDLDTTQTQRLIEASRAYLVRSLG